MQAFGAFGIEVQRFCPRISGLQLKPRLFLRREKASHTAILFDLPFDIDTTKAADQCWVDLPGISKGNVLQGERVPSWS